MHRHFKRPGIKALKFIVEVHMTKVELKLAQQCRISVIFKRGQYKKETVNAPVLEKGQAYFDEKLAVPTLFYFDENRNTFLDKEATLALNMISSKAQRLIGITKFNLATFLNKNEKETYVELKMDKCVDKTAKFCFKLNMAQISELDPCASFQEDESLLQSQIEDSKRISSKIYYDENNPNFSGIVFTDHSDFGEGRSLSPLSKSIGFVKDKAGPFSRRQTSPNVDLDTSIDTKRSSNRKDLSAPNSHRNITTPRSQEKSPVLRKEIKKKLMPPNESKVDETPKWSNNLKKFESPFREPKEKSFSLPSIEEIDGNKVDSNEMKEQSHTTIPKPESITHIEERQNFEQSPFKYESKLTFEVRIEKEVKATPLPRQQEVRLSVEESAREKNTLPRPVEITQNQNDFFEEENIKKAKIPESEDITPELRRDILEERIIELEAQVKEYEQTTKDLYDQLQFSNKEYEILSQDYGELKQEYNTLFMDYQKKNPVSDKKNEKRAELDLSIYKEKVVSLQQELEELRAQKANEIGKTDPVNTESVEEGPNTQKRSGSIEKYDVSLIEEYKNTISNLRHELKTTKQKLSDIQHNQNKEIEKNKITISELTAGINKFSNELEQRDQKIEALEKHIKELEEKNRSSLKALQMKEKKISETEKNAFVAKENIEYENEDNEFLEDYYKKTIQDLTTQNANLKNELEEVRKITENSSQMEKEDTKESLNTTKTSPQKDEKIEGLMKEVKRLESENIHLNNDLQKSKKGWAATDLENYNLMNLIKEMQEKDKVKDEKLDLLENELFSLKFRMAELINATMELGDIELVDKIEEIVTAGSPKQKKKETNKKKSVLS